MTDWKQTLTVENSSDETERINPVSNVNKFSLVTDGNVTKVIVWPHNTLVATRLGEGEGKTKSDMPNLCDGKKIIEDTVDDESNAHVIDKKEIHGEREGKHSEFGDEGILQKHDADACVGTEEDINAQIVGNTCSTQNANEDDQKELENNNQGTSPTMDDGKKKKNTNDEVELQKSVTKSVSVPLEDLSLEVPITGPNDSFIIHGDNQTTSVVMFACRKCPEIFYSLTAYNQHLFRKHRITYVSRYPAKIIERLVSPKKTVPPYSKKCDAQPKNSDMKVDADEDITFKNIGEGTAKKKCESEKHDDEEKDDVVISETLDAEQHYATNETESMSDMKIKDCHKSSRDVLINNPAIEKSTVGEECEDLTHVQKITFSKVQSPKGSPNARKPKSFWISQHSEESLPAQVTQRNANDIRPTEKKNSKRLGYVGRSKRPRKSTQTSNAKETEKIRDILDGNEVQELEETDGESDIYMNVKLPKDELARYQRKFACNYCETKTFTEQGYLLHVRNEHKINYQCFNCLKPFHFEDSFQRHRKICMEGPNTS